MRTAPAWPRPPPATLTVKSYYVALGDAKRLLQDHPKHGARNSVERLAATRALPGPGFDPDPRDRILAFAGGIGASLRIELLHIARSRLAQAAAPSNLGAKIKFPA